MSHASRVVAHDGLIRKHARPRIPCRRLLGRDRCSLTPAVTDNSNSTDDAVMVIVGGW
jgi:hypothetical protein